MLSGEINELKNLAHCYCRLATTSGEVKVQYIALQSLLTARIGPFIEEKLVKSPEISPRSSGVGDSRCELNAMKNLAPVTADLPRCRARSTCDASRS